MLENLGCCLFFKLYFWAKKKKRFFKINRRLWKKLSWSRNMNEIRVLWIQMNWKACHALLHNYQEQLFTRLKTVN